ncbi:MAG: peptidyl-prolyl cis-trans isomerase [Desulfobulbaceae bacterium]
MHEMKVLIVALVLCIVPLTWLNSVQAAVDGTVVTIDGDELTAEDIRNWWRNWREEGMTVPDTPDPYIEWQLFLREAEKMNLFDDPRYRHELEVYLKVTSLVSLKNEEVDGKIDYNEENLWSFYQEYFSPQWLLNILIFKDQESAEKTVAELRAGNTTVAELAKTVAERGKQEQAKNPHGEEAVDVESLQRQAGAGETLLGVQEKVAKRPYGVEMSWRESLAAMNKGDFSPPLSWQDVYVVLQPVDSVPGDREDFAAQKNNVQNRYRKYRTAVLTNDLVGRLKKKYAVKIDQERINGLDPNLPLEQYGDTPVITFSTMTVSERQLMEKVKEEIEVNKKYGFQQEELGAMVRRIADGVMSQTLITMESLDRHYERKSPTKELFDFYQRHKLVKKLEEHIRGQAQEVSDEEIAAYYQEHLADFTSPQIYQMAMIEGAEEDLKKVWLDVVVNGKDVMATAEERLGQRPQVASYPANHLTPEVKARADALAKNDLSQVFPSGEGFAMLYMVESVPSRTPKLTDVREMIAKKLRNDRFQEEKEKYLLALREKSEIKINDKTWKKLREELVKDHEKK